MPPAPPPFSRGDPSRSLLVVAEAKEGWVVVTDCFKPQSWLPVFLNKDGNEEHGFYDAAIFETAEQACDFWSYLSGDKPFTKYGVCQCKDI